MGLCGASPTSTHPHLVACCLPHLGGPQWGPQGLREGCCCTLLCGAQLLFSLWCLRLRPSAGCLECVISLSLAFSLWWGSWKVLLGFCWPGKPPGFPNTLTPEAPGQGQALPCSLPSSDTGPGLSDWLWDFWCPLSPRSKARRRAVWLHPEPG